MTQHVPAAPHEDLVSPRPTPASQEGNPLSSVLTFIEKTLTIVGLEARKLRHDPSDLVMRAIQPALWLLIFGEVFARLRAIPTGGRSYIDFMAPGILAQSVLFISIFSGISIIWERALGLIHKFLSRPTPRAALVLGKAFSSGLRALSQAVIIYLLALLLGVKMSWNPLDLLGVLVMVILGAGCFSTFSLIVACLVRTRDRFMGIGQVMTMPLFIASNAIYPIAIMPNWLQVIARANPLSYMVDALRAMMLAGGTSTDGLGLDFLILFVVMVVLILIGAQLYPRVAQ